MMSATHKIFLSTPSARRATPVVQIPFVVLIISIHALREEGDRWRSSSKSGRSDFYPRPPRGGRPWEVLNRRSVFDFYPRPPRGGRRVARAVRAVIVDISIHALREEGDSICAVSRICDIRFLSTPSARRATAKTETKSLFSYKLYNILHEFRRALIYNGSKNYPNHAK